jgi:uncharacterized phage protein (TIGR02216 family)
MSLGLGLLRHSPRDFWAMTPRELAAAATAHGWALLDAPRRAELASLMAHFPDTGAD